MAKPVSAPITTPPSTPSSNYDATSHGPLGPWVKLGRSGPASLSSGQSGGGDFPSSGSTWQQV
jgi:hypothetical protein